MWKNLKSSSPAVDSRPDNSGGRGGANASPMEMFVVSEMGLAYEIVVSVDATIEAIKQVVYGTGLLTPMIQGAATELLAGRVPGGWMKRWEGPEKVRVCGWLLCVEWEGVGRFRAVNGWGGVEGYVRERM